MSQFNDFIADPRRVVLGMIVAPAAGALAAEVPTFLLRDFWQIWLLGLLSVVTLYLPLVLWRLPRTRHPFLTCVVVGAVSAPGLVGYSVAIMISLLGVGAGWAGLVLLVTFPLGAIGGAAFWLAAVWRSEGWKNALDEGQPGVADDGIRVTAGEASESLSR